MPHLDLLILGTLSVRAEEDLRVLPGTYEESNGLKRGGPLLLNALCIIQSILKCTGHSTGNQLRSLRAVLADWCLGIFIKSWAAAF